jgi:hypothetical protein
MKVLERRRGREVLTSDLVCCVTAVAKVREFSTKKATAIAAIATTTTKETSQAATKTIKTAKSTRADKTSRVIKGYHKPTKCNSGRPAGAGVGGGGGGGGGDGLLPVLQ